MEGHWKNAVYNEAKSPSTAKILILFVGNWKTYGLIGSKGQLVQTLR